MEKLVLVRHGEKTVDTNDDKTVDGTVVGLTCRGKRQVMAAAFALGREFPSLVGAEVMVSSPMSRAQESAEIMAKILDIREILLRPAITEWKPSSNPDSKVRKAEIRRMLLDPQYVAECGKSLEQLSAEVLGVFEDEDPRIQNQSVLLGTSHGLAIRGTAFALNRLLVPPEDKVLESIQTGGYTVFERNGSSTPVVEQFNQYDFMPVSIR